MGRLDVLVIGAGFGGLAAAIRLRARAGLSFLLVEQASEVGGTWQANRYPGAACDIPSHLYSLSFAPNPHWTRKYPGQAEIQAYLAGLVDRFDLGPTLRLGTRVTGLHWADEAREWEARLETADDGVTTVRARSVVCAVGGLSQPHRPALPGLERFAGRTIHSAEWPRGLDLSGQRIGVIGTGASAIQIVPRLAGIAERLTLFQRTPAWVLPRRDAALPGWQRWACARVPGFRLALRGLIYAVHEARAPAFVRHPEWLARAEPMALRFLKHQVPRGPLRDALTPNYRMGCKRILIADDYYPALQRPNVRLVTAGIAEIVAEGVRTADGELHALQTLVLATGFEAAQATPRFPIAGEDGRTLAQAWAEAPQAHLGTTVHGFPNFFLVVGPNTGLGHNSMVHVIESQVAYILDALARLQRVPGAVLRVREAAQRDFNDEVQRRMARTVWRSGCHSWYQARDGRITTLWPGSTLEFRRRTRRIDPSHYQPLAA